MYQLYYINKAYLKMTDRYTIINHSSQDSITIFTTSSTVMHAPLTKRYLTIIGSNMSEGVVRGEEWGGGDHSTLSVLKSNYGLTETPLSSSVIYYGVS